MSDTDHIYSIFKIALDILVAYIVKNANANKCYTCCLVIHYYKQEYNNTVILIEMPLQP